MSATVLVLLQVILMVWEAALVISSGDICALSSSEDVLAPLAA